MDMQQQRISDFEVHRKYVRDKNNTRIYLDDYIYDDNNKCHGQVIGFSYNSNEEGIIMIDVKKTNKNGLNNTIHKYNPKEFNTLRLIGLQVKLKNKKLAKNELYVNSARNGKIILQDKFHKNFIYKKNNKIKNVFNFNDIQLKFKTSTFDKISTIFKKNHMRIK